MSRLRRDTWALPVDLYRVSMGLLLFLYFSRLVSEWSDFTSYGGYLDHELVLRIFWFVGGVNLFQPWMSDLFFLAMLVLGLACTVAIIVGWRVKLCALVAMVIAVSNFRWNFPVANLDDTSMQFGLFWIMLLPTGKTLILSEAWRDPAGAMERWKAERVPSAAVWAYFANLVVVYLVTGLTKLDNAWWRQGLALFIILRLPIASTSTWWGMGALPVTRIFNWLTLIVEPLLPFTVLLPKGHPLKWLAFFSFVGLHLGILTTIGIPYANLGLLCALWLVYREEVMGWLDAPPLDDGGGGRRPLSWRERFAWFMVVVFAMSMTEGIPFMEALYIPGFAIQWSLGMAQEYHLFDWIDKFNYVVHNRVEVRGADGAVHEADSALVFPKAIRGFLVQSYLFNMRWMRVPKGQMGELQRTLKFRAADRFARLYHGPGQLVKVIANVQRATDTNLNLDQGEDRVLMEFTIENGQAHMLSY